MLWVGAQACVTAQKCAPAEVPCLLVRHPGTFPLSSFFPGQPLYLQDTLQAGAQVNRPELRFKKTIITGLVLL